MQKSVLQSAPAEWGQTCTRFQRPKAACVDLGVYDVRTLYIPKYEQVVRSLCLLDTFCIYMNEDQKWKNRCIQNLQTKNKLVQFIQSMKLVHCIEARWQLLQHFYYICWGWSSQKPKYNWERSSKRVKLTRDAPSSVYPWWGWLPRILRLSEHLSASEGLTL